MATSHTGSTRWKLALASLILILVALQPGVATRVLADPLSPITVTKTANPSPVVSGGLLTYTITMVNTGGAKLTNLVMTDQVNGVGVNQTPPALPQLTITSSQGNCTQGGPNGNVVTCSGGTLNGGASWFVTISGQVTASNGTTLNNTAAVSGTKSAQTFNTTATVQVPVLGGTGGGSPQPDLTINKTGPSSVAASSPMTYTLTVNNVGTANTSNVKVVDTVPAGVTGISAAGTSLFVCSVASQTVTCTGGAVNAGANATITINGTSPGTAGTITNTSVVDPDNTIAESNELNNTSATVNTSVGLPPSGPLLGISKTDGSPAPAGTWWTGAGPDPVTPGQQITYKVQVTNNATGNNSRADDVIVTDGTQGLEASSITATQVIVNGALGVTGGCVVAAPQVRCNIRSLNSGGTLTITIKGTVISSAGSTIFNTATVTGNVKNTGVTNTASEATTVKPAVDLTITKADAPDPVCARSWPIDGPPTQHLSILDVGLGSSASGTPAALLAPPVCLGGLTYSFVVGNSGIANATGVVVRDPLPAGLIFDSYGTDAGFICSVDAGNVVTCSGGTVPAESIRNLAFRMVAPPTLGMITNTVTIDPNNAIFEPDETNNTATTTTNVATGVDLVIWKSDSNAVDPPGVGAPTLNPGTSTNLGDGYDPIATSGTQTVTIYVDNVGTQDTTGIRLRDTLPAGTRFLSVIADPLHGFTCAHNGAPTGGVVECVGGFLLGTESEFYNPAGPALAGPGDDFATIKIRFFARPEVGTMHNEVRVDPLNEIAEANELNNLATDDTTVSVGNADKGAYHQLAVVKTHVSPTAGTVATNGILVYNLAVSNLGTDPVSNIILVDTLPAGTRYIEAKDTDTGTDAFFCSHDGSALGGAITCVGGDLDGSINTIPVGGVTRNVTVKVFAPDTPGTYTNLATVDPNNLVPEGNEFDNDAQLNTIVAPCVGQTACTTTNAFYELTIGKTQFSPTPPIAVATNGVITYDLLVTNLGSDPVYGVVVKDTLPAGSRFIDAQDVTLAIDPTATDSTAAFSCGEPDGTNTLTCVGGTLDGTLATLGSDVPQARTIRIRLFAPNTPATYPNQSRVDPANAVPEGNEFNNTSNINTPVAPCVEAACTAANAFYEFTIKKEQNRPTIARNGLETYTLTITNWGSDPISDIVVEDALPVGARLLDAKDSGPPSDPAAFTCGAPNTSNVITCAGGDLSGTNPAVALAGVPTSRQIVIRAFMPDLSATYPNSAVVDPSNLVPEGNEFNNQSSLVTDVQNGGPNPYINLTVEKTDTTPDSGEPNTVPPASLIFYTIVVSNPLAEGDAFNVTVTDILPFGATYFVANDSEAPAAGTPPEGAFVCAEADGVVTCTGGAIPAGGSRTILVKAFAPTGLEQFVLTDPGLDAISIFIVNRAFVDPDNAILEGDETDNTDYVATKVKSKINLIVESKTGPDTAQQNQETDYVITVKNEKVYGDGAIAVGAVIVDTLPVGLIPLSVSANAANMLCSIQENPVNVVTCVGDIAPDQQVVITVHVFITASSGTMYNQACIDPGHLIDETNELDNCKTKTTAVGETPPPPEPPAPNLLMGKTADKGALSTGEQLVYTLAVSNVGTGATTAAVVLTDTLPTEVTHVNLDPDAGWDCALSTLLVISCTRPSLGQGELSSVRVTVTLNSGVAAPFDNTATVSGGGDTTPANNSDTVTTSVGGSGIDLSIASITDAPDPVNSRPSELTYTIVAVNLGTAPALNAIVRVDLPDTGTTVAGVAGTNGFNCVPNLAVDPLGKTFDCTGSFDAAGGTNDQTIITAIITVNADAPNDLVLTATVDPGFAFAESDESNNTASETTTVSNTVCTTLPCVDLVVSSITDTDPASAPGTITYIVSIVNVGDAPVPATAIWDIHIRFFGTGSPTLTGDIVPQCAVVPPPADHHVHCTSQAGPDLMDLAPGAGFSFTVTVTGVPASTVSLEVTADIFGVIAEFSEDNNSIIESTLVNP